nr:PDZ domain-containing protein [Sphingopyxis panaciterrae]
MVEIDPDRGALRFWTNGSDNINNWLPVVQKADGLFCTTIKPKPGLEAAAIVDLGCSTPLYISAEYAKENDLFSGMRRGSSASLGVEGVAVSQLGRLESLRVGDVILHDVPFAVPPLWRFAAPMIMGLPLLMRFHCRLAFGRSRMQLVRASGSNRPFVRDASGLSVLHAGDHLQVIHVAKHSPAARAGLCEGDNIIAINDERVGAAGTLIHRNLGKRPPGTRYALSMLAKDDLELVLEEYY